VLRHRLANPADYFSLHGEIAPRYGSDPFIHSKLPEFWAALFGSPAAVPLMVDDLSGGAPRAAASRLVVAAKPKFADAVVAGEVQPPLAVEAVQRFLDGEQVWLTPVELKLANKGEGVRLVTLHIWEAVPKEMPRLYCDVCASQTEGMAMNLKGANVSELIEDAIDPYHSEVNHAIGYFPRAKFDCGGWVGSITKADAEKNWAMHFASLFQYRPPRLELSASFKELLRPAMEGMTDEELADRLCLSLSAVKKRWAAIYDHVSMKGIHAGLPACEGKRGPERRRLLLEYLRWHPEELNPIALH
jgi:hypothetical protein